MSSSFKLILKSLDIILERGETVKPSQLSTTKNRFGFKEPKSFYINYDNNQYLKLIRFPKRKYTGNQDVKLDDFSNIEDIDEWYSLSKTWDLDTKEGSGLFGPSYDYQNSKYQLYNLFDDYKGRDRYFSNLFIDIKGLLSRDFKDDSKWLDGRTPGITDTDIKTDPVYIKKVKISNSKAKLALLGDFHSSLHSLIDILHHLKVAGYFRSPEKMLLKRDRYIFFLGDLIDRGAYGLEILLIVFILKRNNPENVFIINGNHEDFETYLPYGASEETKHQFPRFSKEFNYNGNPFIPTLFYLPSAIYLDFNGTNYHLSHGAFDIQFSGFNEEGRSYDESKNKVKKFLESEYSYALVESYEPNNQYKWGDFEQRVFQNGEEVPWSLDRSGRNRYSSGLVQKYCQLNGISSLITGHQDRIDFGLILPDDQVHESEDRMGIPFNKVKDKVGHTIGYYRGGYRPYSFELSRTYKDGLFELRPFIDKEPIYGEVEDDVVLKPGRDFNACVTSSAIVSKGVPQNTFLELDDNRDFARKRDVRRGSYDHVLDIIKGERES